ncbi:hypothetical protein [Williamwhitmania taraxaci]|uniref:Uncharacterized protein n=1 Tax=Williamwhitmania taraxaci TaxID=1640674 RepID=A0A1G6S5A7_9BACT|nr:hypothetical protein [Williamwhitmania taraxaci]SDD12080.1 hypothetical protein SAMN05216323_10878 [Williamwhitmania taraxaci]
MKIIRKIVAIQMAIMVALTSGGFTVFLNLCGCTQEVTLSILSTPEACCGTQLLCDTESNSTHGNLIGEENCCKTITSYQKLSETTAPCSVAPIFADVTTLLNGITHDEPSSNKIEVTSIKPPPLIRSGKLLVLFLNNPKIPSHQIG